MPNASHRVHASHTMESLHRGNARPRLAWCGWIAVVAMALAGCASIPGPLGSGGPACVPHFAYADGWLGGDAVYSVPVPGGLSRRETVWIFGDTYVGQPGAKDRAGATLIHNSVGLSECRASDGFELEYGWRVDETGEPRAIFETGRERHYVWPFDGFFLGDQLYVLLLEVREDTPRGPLGLPIRITRSLVARVENPDDPPAYWRVDLRPLTDDGGPLLTPGVFVEHGFVHMMATPNSDQGAHPRFLVRLPIDVVEDWPEDLRPALETFSNRGAWEPGLHAPNARILMRDNATEMSIDRSEQTGRYFAVYGAPLQTGGDGSASPTPALDANSIFVRTALSLVGPWSERQRLLLMPEGLEAAASETGNGTICYAAKAHAEHSPPGVLSLTYVCNLSPGPGGDVWATLEAMQTRMDVYRPRVATHPWPQHSEFDEPDDAENANGQ